MVNLPSGSSVPGALVAIMSIAAAALPAGTTVHYGPELFAYAAPLTFMISQIPGDQVPAELGPDYRREETFSFTCSLIYYEGGVPDFVAHLQTLMTNFVLLSRAIANNPTLNQAVRFAEVGNFLISPETDANGQSATTIDFSIRCQQRVTSLT